MDSRDITPGIYLLLLSEINLMVARFIEPAIANGAVAVIAEPELIYLTLRFQLL